MMPFAVAHPMCRSLLRSLAAATLGATALLAQLPAAPKYPASVRGSQFDDMGGTRIPDPYRWLEGTTSAEVRAWVSAQNGATESFMAQLPRRRDVRDALYRAWSYHKYSAPFAAGERLFYFENGGLENQPPLYVQDRRDTPPRELLDPNAFSHDGLIAVVDHAASPEGRYLAYAVTTQGSAWRVVRVRDVRTGQDMGEELRGVKSGPLSWTRDERGFFYVRADAARPVATAAGLAADGRQQVLYHRTGRPQSEDVSVYENTRAPTSRLRATVSEDGQYVVIEERNGVAEQNRVVFIDLDNPGKPNLGAPLVRLFDANDALYEFVANVGPVFYFRTTRNAPRARLVAVDINSPDENHWTTVVRETYDPLVAARRVDDRFVAHRLHDAHSVLELYALDGGVRGSIALPGIGTVTEINGRPEHRELYFTFTSYVQQPTVYRYDLDTRSAAVYREVRGDSTSVRFETTQLFFGSKDGTRIPMFVTARRGITLDGSHPAILTGIGSFGISATPAFSPAVAAWLELGGIYAVANVRGGGEYGRAWHEAATRDHKTVAMDDFNAAAEFLSNQRYTRAELLGAYGKGAGGLLAAGAVTMRPELFGAAVYDAGLLDMARFNRFTVGAGWTAEFGSPGNGVDLKFLLAYSPLQNLKPGVRYPPTLVTVGDHDEVVTPIPSYKFAATSQSLTGAVAPLLLRVDYDAGYGPGVPTAKQIAVETDQLTFLLTALRSPR
jgi:prolyl oligopeptidase